MCQNSGPLLSQVLSDSSSSPSAASRGHLAAVVSPHTLVSGTAFAQALYCARKALLADRFRGPGSNLAMTVGRIAHELFQVALAQHPTNLSRDWLFRLWRRRFLPEICLDLVGMQCSLERFEEELSPYMDNIAAWIRTHILGPHPKPIAYLKRPLSQFCSQKEDEEAMDELCGSNCGGEKVPVYFNAIRDIEENVWTPTLGLKGRIDVSFLASSSPSHSAADRKSIGISPNGRRHKTMVMPLELKTGKSYGNGVDSTEHHSQVLIYSMMLAERANDGRIGPGFLLYLRDNALVEVRPRMLELRGLLQMRNRLADKHFSRFSIDSLPAPLNDPRMCRLCPFSALCGTLSPNIRFATDIGTTNARNSRSMEDEQADEIIWLDSSTPFSAHSTGSLYATERGSTKRRRHYTNNNEFGQEEKKQGAEQEEDDGNDKENMPPGEERRNAEELDTSVAGLSPEMRAFLSASTAHLRDAEVSYAKRCIRRTLAQWAEADQRGSTKTLFTKSPAERERLGTCFANMELLTTTSATSSNHGSSNNDGTLSDQSTSGVLLRFRKASNTNGIFSYSSVGATTTKQFAMLEPGSVVTVSTDHAFALLMATIVSVDAFDCSVKLHSDKDLPANFDQQQQPLSLYHLDKHDGFSSFAFRLGSVAALLANDEQAQRLRSILTLGRAHSTAMIPSSSSNPLARLSLTSETKTTDNITEEGTSQQHQTDDAELVVVDNDCTTFVESEKMSFLADDPLKEPLERVLNTPDFSIVMGHDQKGVLAFLLILCRTLLRLNKSVLFCARSNAAVDELLQLLVADCSIPDEHILRLGRRQAVKPGLQHLLLDTKMAQFADDPAKLENNEKAKAFYCRTKQLSQQKPLLVACPLASVPSNVFLSSSIHFDFCLVDEASELADIELIRPLLIAERFALCTAQKKPEKNSLLSRLIPMITNIGTSSPRRLITLGGPPIRQPMLQISCANFVTKLPVQNAGPVAAETPTGERNRNQQTAKRRRTMTLYDFWKK